MRITIPVTITRTIIGKPTVPAARWTWRLRARRGRGLEPSGVQLSRFRRRDEEGESEDHEEYNDFNLRYCFKLADRL